MKYIKKKFKHRDISFEIVLQLNIDGANDHKVSTFCNSFSPLYSESETVDTKNLIATISRCEEKVIKHINDTLENDEDLRLELAELGFK